MLPVRASAPRRNLRRPRSPVDRALPLLRRRTSHLLRGVSPRFRAFIRALPMLLCTRLRRPSLENEPPGLVAAPRRRRWGKLCEQLDLPPPTNWFPVRPLVQGVLLAPTANERFELLVLPVEGLTRSELLRVSTRVTALQHIAERHAPELDVRMASAAELTPSLFAWAALPAGDLPPNLMPESAVSRADEIDWLEVFSRAPSSLLRCLTLLVPRDAMRPLDLARSGFANAHPLSFLGRWSGAPMARDVAALLERELSPAEFEGLVRSFRSGCLEALQKRPFPERKLLRKLLRGPLFGRRVPRVLRPQLDRLLETWSPDEVQTPHGWQLELGGCVLLRARTLDQLRAFALAETPALIARGPAWQRIKAAVDQMAGATGSSRSGGSSRHSNGGWSDGSSLGAFSRRDAGSLGADAGTARDDSARGFSRDGAPLSSRDGFSRSDRSDAGSSRYGGTDSRETSGFSTTPRGYGGSSGSGLHARARGVLVIEPGFVRHLVALVPRSGRPRVQRVDAEGLLRFALTWHRAGVPLELMPTMGCDPTLLARAAQLLKLRVQPGEHVAFQIGREVLLLGDGKPRTLPIERAFARPRAVTWVPEQAEHLRALRRPTLNGGLPTVHVIALPDGEDDAAIFALDTEGRLFREQVPCDALEQTLQEYREILRHAGPPTLMSATVHPFLTSLDGRRPEAHAPVSIDVECTARGDRAWLDGELFGAQSGGLGWNALAEAVLSHWPPGVWARVIADRVFAPPGTNALSLLAARSRVLRRLTVHLRRIAHSLRAA